MWCRERTQPRKHTGRFLCPYTKGCCLWLAKEHPYGKSKAGASRWVNSKSQGDLGRRQEIEPWGSSTVMESCVGGSGTGGGTKERGCSPPCHLLAWRGSGSLQLTASSSFLLQSFAQERLINKQSRWQLFPQRCGKASGSGRATQQQEGTVRVNEPWQHVKWQSWRAKSILHWKLPPCFCTEHRWESQKQVTGRLNQLDKDNYFFPFIVNMALNLRGTWV